MANNSYSQFQPKILEHKGRVEKARQIIHVLKDFYHKKRLAKLTALDIGCSTGIITKYVGKNLKRIVGVDVDESALKLTKPTRKVNFIKMNGTNLTFKDSSFDLVICHQVYYYVADTQRLFDEIYRVLKPGGCCYFSGLNRLIILDRDLRLPFSPLMPRQLSRIYAQLFGKNPRYVNYYLTYWQLRRRIKKFQIVRYGPRMIKNSRLFAFKPVVRYQALLQYVPLSFFYLLEPFFTNFVWLLVKPGTKKT